MKQFDYSNKTLENTKAEEIFQDWMSTDTPKFDLKIDVELRDYLSPVLASAKNVTVNSEKSKIKYNMDIAVGMALYDLLSPEELGLRNASNDGFWKYLSLIVLPDLVFERWGLNKDRYWYRINRIWLKTVWWYMHLSWQGGKEETIQCLQAPNLSSDTIVQLVERAGRDGYRVSLYRSILNHAVKQRLTQDEFRALMTLNTVMTVTVEPALYPKGEDEYVAGLITRIRRAR